MRILLLVATGSLIGGVFRYLTAQFIQNKFLSAFPFGTLGVNIMGCLIIGLVFGLSEKINLPVEWRMFLATGICGGFTTFSSFSHETFGLLRDGQFWYAFVYMASSVVLGLLATFIGISMLKLF